MSAVVIAGDTSGSITLDAPAVAGTTTLTLPATSGTVMVNGPAFSAYLSSTQNISANTWTKVQFQTEEFDTNSNYDNSSNYRFTPTVAGYYQVNATVTPNSANTAMAVSIYKNGSQFKRGNSISNVAGDGVTISVLIYMNGTTDYIEGYWFTGTTQTPAADLRYTYFQAYLARSA
jgi:hypothetical protein